MSIIWLEDALKIIEKIVGEHSLEQQKKKPRLRFNPRLALISLQTTEPWHKGYEKRCDPNDISGLESLANFVFSCQKPDVKSQQGWMRGLNKFSSSESLICFCGNMLHCNWPHVPLELCF